MVLREQAALFRQLRALFSAGIPLSESLRYLVDSCPNKQLSLSLGNVWSRVQVGWTLSKAMAAEQGAFPPTCLGLVHLGENTGQLDVCLKSAADYLEMEYKRHERVVSALIYPASVLVGSGLLLLGLMGYFVPRMYEVMEPFQAQLTGVARLWVWVGFLASSRLSWVYALQVVALGLYLSWRLLSRPAGQAWVNDRLLSLPLVGAMLHRAAQARISCALGQLLEAGADLSTSLRLAAVVAGSPVYVASLDKIRGRVEEGSSLPQAFADQALYPRLFAVFLEVASESGSPSQAFQRIHRLLAEDLEHRVDTALALLEPTVMILLGGIVALVVLAFFAPMAQVVSHL